MNAVTKAEAPGLPAKPALAEMPQDVADAIAQFLDPEPFGPRVRCLPAKLRERCAAAVARMDARSAPAPFATVKLWLLALSVVTFAPSGADFDVHAGAVAAACSDLPGWAFNPAAQVAALRHFAKWPAPAEVHAFLAEQIRPERDTARALRALATASPPDDSRGSTQAAGAPSAAEREAVAEQLAALRREMAGGQAAHSGRAGSANARPLSPAHLRAALEAQIGTVAPEARAALTARLAMLGSAA